MSTSTTLAPRELSQFIDHTLLRPDAKENEILKLCDEAVEFDFKAICVERKWLSAALPRLKGSRVLAATVVAFPSGSASAREKSDEARAAVAQGAQEIDMVLNRELLKERRYADLLEDIAGVVRAAPGVPVKVILETSELARDQKVIACAIASAAGAAFVKTSTGFSSAGATESDVRLMRETVGPALGVKASGGIRRLADALKMLSAGASRLGTSASVSILREAMQGH